MTKACSGTTLGPSLIPEISLLQNMPVSTDRLTLNRRSGGIATYQQNRNIPIAEAENREQPSCQRPFSSGAKGRKPNTTRAVPRGDGPACTGAAHLLIYPREATLATNSEMGTESGQENPCFHYLTCLQVNSRGL